MFPLHCLNICPKSGLKGSLRNRWRTLPSYKERKLLIEKYPDSEKATFPACAADFDEWSALANFLADMIEKYAEILVPEIESKQIPVDECLAARYNVLVIAVQTQ